MDFIGRKQELATLQGFLKKTTASLIVVRGRRRIGKSRLIQEFAKQCKFYHFAGIAPTNSTTAQSQRNEFSSQLSAQGFPHIQATDWNDLFWLLNDKIKNHRAIILFDEISWMGSKDHDFLGKLKNAWDIHFKKNNKLMLVLCGSASSWIEKNILSSTGFVGRISFTLTLNELPLNECKYFWKEYLNNISAMEKLKILSVTGGIPRYLEEINPKLSAEDNIKNMCFTKGALLTTEFEHIFSNIFLRDSETYRKIIIALIRGAKEYSKICHELNASSSGRILEYLSELELAGFIRRDYAWHLKTGCDAKLSKFRLCDNYVRFYLKYIKKNQTKIDRNSFKFTSLAALPGWNSIIALQFENLVLNNRPYLWQQLNINPEMFLSENPFFQRGSTKQPGCQIDYLIQTRFDSLYVCEIKFSRKPIPSSIIHEIQKKIDNLKRPKGTSCRPVLIHLNGVDEEIIDSHYFYTIIDFSKILDSNTSHKVL
jgi:uncharacterized protein